MKKKIYGEKQLQIEFFLRPHSIESYVSLCSLSIRHSKYGFRIHEVKWNQLHFGSIMRIDENKSKYLHANINSRNSIAFF